MRRALIPIRASAAPAALAAPAPVPLLAVVDIAQFGPATDSLNRVVQRTQLAGWLAGWLAGRLAPPLILKFRNEALELSLAWLKSYSQALRALCKDFELLGRRIS